MIHLVDLSATWTVVIRMLLNFSGGQLQDVLRNQHLEKIQNGYLSIFFLFNSCFDVSATMVKKSTSPVSSDFKSVFVRQLIGKVLSFNFYPKALFFKCLFRFSLSAIVHVQN